MNTIDFQSVDHATLTGYLSHGKVYFINWPITLTTTSFFPKLRYLLDQSN